MSRTEADLIADDPDLVVSRRLPDGRVLAVRRLLWGRAQLCLDPMSMPGGLSDGGYDDVWDYPNLSGAVAALLAWDGEGEPTGWHRHPASGRRRPDCDPAREYVRE